MSSYSPRTWRPMYFRNLAETASRCFDSSMLVALPGWRRWRERIRCLGRRRQVFPLLLLDYSTELLVKIHYRAWIPEKSDESVVRSEFPHLEAETAFRLSLGRHLVDIELDLHRDRPRNGMAGAATFQRPPPLPFLVAYP